MSNEAESWAFNLAPVPMDAACECRDGLDYHGGTSATSCTGPCTRAGCDCVGYRPRAEPKPNPACAAVLIGLANHADPGGRDCYPSTRRLVRYTRLAERTVQTALDRLEAEGIIVPGDPEIAAAKIKRGDRRPKIFDLDMSLVRTDLPDDEMRAIAREVRYLAPLVDRYLSHKSDGVQPLHPVDTGPTEPAPRGATTAPRDPHGVQPRQPRGAMTAERGAVVAPKQSLNSQLEEEQLREPDSVGLTPATNDGETDTEAKPGRKPRRPPATTIPDDYAPSPLLLEWARTKAPDVDVVYETDQFKRWHQGKGTEWRLWDRAWQNWMSKAHQDKAGATRGSGPRTRPANGHWQQGDEEQLAGLF